MPTTSTEFRGKPVLCNLTRKEDDTDDITVHLTDPETDGDAVVVGWTATLEVSLTRDGAPVVGGTFTGVGAALSPSDGNIIIDMNSFAIAPGTYFYDVRIIDTVTGDTPARVFFEGKFKVKDRIKV